MGFLKVVGRLKSVFSNWKYFLILIFTAFIFYYLNVLVSSWIVLDGLYSSMGFFRAFGVSLQLSFGFWEVAKLHSFISLVVLSVLFGMFISLMIYKSRIGLKSKGSTGFLGGIGVFLAILVPGCAACGVGLLSVLGLSAGLLAFLPYEGLELSIIAIVLLSITIFKITENLDSCKIDISLIERGSRK